MVNIGKSIRAELNKQERSVSWLAQKLGCNRISVYRIFDKNSIDTALLARISVILQHDFFKDLSEEINTRCFNFDTEVYHP